MASKRPHSVEGWPDIPSASTPLPDDRDLDAFVFPGQLAGKPLSNMAMLALIKRMRLPDVTPHGFRSTFRDWAAETTGHPNDVIELALAHTVGSKVEAAYRRGDMFQKRQALMDDWAAYCCGRRERSAPTGPPANSSGS